MIHPKARIIAEAGPIVIGEGNLIEEQALIINGSIGSWIFGVGGCSPVQLWGERCPSAPGWMGRGLVQGPVVMFPHWVWQRFGVF